MTAKVSEKQQPWSGVDLVGGGVYCFEACGPSVKYHLIQNSCLGFRGTVPLARLWSNFCILIHR